MAYDTTTPPDALADALSGTHDSFQVWQAARAELARRSELAKRYERLTRALAVHVTFNLDMLLTGDNVQVGSCEDFDYVRDPASHDGTPDSIAAAIIAAAEGAR